MQYSKWSIGFVLILGLSTELPATASMAILHKQPTDLVLSEKTGLAENLVDNPARLTDVNKCLLDNFIDWKQEENRPGDPVFKKWTWNNRFNCSSQAVVPLWEGLAINVGGNYAQVRTGNKSVSNLDQTTIQELTKESGRRINGAAAFRINPKTVLGYSLYNLAEEKYGEMDSDINQPYSAKTTQQALQHTLGMNWGALDAFLSLTSEKYQGSYDGIPEVDFGFAGWSLVGRYVLGTLDHENCVIKIKISNNHWKQKLFLRDRQNYPLDFENYMGEASACHFQPGPNLTWATAVEIKHADKARFAAAENRWTPYQASQIDFLLWIRLPVLPGVHFWDEIKLSCIRNTAEETNQVQLHNRVGLQVQVDCLELNLYVLPEMNLLNSNQVESVQKMKLGLEIKAEIPALKWTGDPTKQP